MKWWIRAWAMKSNQCIFLSQLLTNCVTLGQLLTISRLEFPLLYNEGGRTYLLELYRMSIQWTHPFTESRQKVRLHTQMIPSFLAAAVKVEIEVKTNHPKCGLNPWLWSHQHQIHTYKTLNVNSALSSDSLTLIPTGFSLDPLSPPVSCPSFFLLGHELLPSLTCLPFFPSSNLFLC